MNIFKKFSINAFLFIVTFSIFSWLVFSFYKAYQPKEFYLQGQIEAQNYNISSKISGRIEKVFVKKGDIVKKGDLIFTLQSPELQAKINQAKAGEKAALAISKQAENGTRKEQIAALFEKWQQAKVASNLAEKTYIRIDNLYKDGVISKQNKDEAYTKYKASKYMSNAAFELYKMAKEGARNEEKIAAKEKALAAKSVLAEVEAFAKDLSIKSFYSGEVTKVLLQDFELAPSGFPVVELTDMNDSWLVLHVKENSLENFKKGSIIKGEIPALSGKSFDFRVSYVSVLGSFATNRATDMQGDYDVRTFEIHARPLEKIKDLRVGMSVLIK